MAEAHASIASPPAAVDAPAPEAASAERPSEAADRARLRRSATVHPAGKYAPGVLRWGYFLVLNAIAGTVAAAIFLAVFYADGLDPYFQGTYDWLLAHPGVTSVMAFSPLACSLLVGYGYAQRARRRKQAAARRTSAGKGQTGASGSA